jgi:hypothetical protein
MTRLAVLGEDGRDVARQRAAGRSGGALSRHRHCTGTGRGGWTCRSCGRSSGLCGAARSCWSCPGHGRHAAGSSAVPRRTARCCGRADNRRRHGALPRRIRATAELGAAEHERKRRESPPPIPGLLAKSHPNNLVFRDWKRGTATRRGPGLTHRLSSAWIQRDIACLRNATVAQTFGFGSLECSSFVCASVGCTQRRWHHSTHMIANGNNGQKLLQNKP